MNLKCFILLFLLALPIFGYAAQDSKTQESDSYKNKVIMFFDGPNNYEKYSAEEIYEIYEVLANFESENKSLFDKIFQESSCKIVLTEEDKAFFIKNYDFSREELNNLYNEDSNADNQALNKVIELAFTNGKLKTKSQFDVAIESDSGIIANNEEEGLKIAQSKNFVKNKKCVIC